MPLPLTASIKLTCSTRGQSPSPVPAYMMLEFVGSITIDETARLAMKSLTGPHETPALAEYQMPPETLPTHILFALVGSITIERIRPPIFPGPNHCQSPGAIAATSIPFGFPAALALFCSAARITFICSRAFCSPSAGITPCSSCSCRLRNFAASSGRSPRASFSSASSSPRVSSSLSGALPPAVAVARAGSVRSGIPAKAFVSSTAEPGD